MSLADAIFGNGTALEQISCCSCGLKFGVPAEWAAQKRRDKSGFKCPNDHALVFSGPSPEEQLKKQLEAKDAELARERERTARVERQRRATKGQLTKVKRRVQKGVCPCCNRYFEQLHRHMTSEHPGFDQVEVIGS